MGRRYDRGVNKAILLDRDGTLIRERNYLCDPDQVELERGALEALQRLEAAGYLLVVVTNQSGIGRGLFTAREFGAVQARLAELLAEGGLSIAAEYHCPHHPTAGVGEYLRACDCRKPAPGMLEQAIRELDLDRSACVMVGDNLSDIGAGRAAGVATVLVRTGYGAELEGRATGPDADPAQRPDYVADDLLDAAEHFILARD